MCAYGGAYMPVIVCVVVRLDTIMTMLSKPLKDVIKAYEFELAVLHPFEATLADLTVRARVKQGYKTLDEVREEAGWVENGGKEDGAAGGWQERPGGRTCSLRGRRSGSYSVIQSAAPCH